MVFLFHIQHHPGTAAVSGVCLSGAQQFLTNALAPVSGIDREVAEVIFVRCQPADSGIQFQQGAEVFEHPGSEPVKKGNSGAQIPGSSGGKVIAQQHPGISTFNFGKDGVFKTEQVVTAAKQLTEHRTDFSTPEQWKIGCGDEQKPGKVISVFTPGRADEHLVPRGWHWHNQSQ